MVLIFVYMHLQFECCISLTSAVPLRSIYVVWEQQTPGQAVFTRGRGGQTHPDPDDISHREKLAIRCTSSNTSEYSIESFGVVICNLHNCKCSRFIENTRFWYWRAWNVEVFYKHTWIQTTFPTQDNRRINVSGHGDIYILLIHIVLCNIQ